MATPPILIDAMSTLLPIAAARSYVYVKPFDTCRMLIVVPFDCHCCSRMLSICAPVQVTTVSTLLNGCTVNSCP
jgi:hypothetical protein